MYVQIFRLFTRPILSRGISEALREGESRRYYPGVVKSRIYPLGGYVGPVDKQLWHLDIQYINTT